MSLQSDWTSKYRRQFRHARHAHLKTLSIERCMASAISRRATNLAATCSSEPVASHPPASDSARMNVSTPSGADENSARAILLTHSFRKEATRSRAADWAHARPAICAASEARPTRCLSGSSSRAVFAHSTRRPPSAMFLMKCRTTERTTAALEQRDSPLRCAACAAARVRHPTCRSQQVRSYGWSSPSELSPPM